MITHNEELRSKGDEFLQTKDELDKLRMVQKDQKCDLIQLITKDRYLTERLLSINYAALGNHLNHLPVV